jgi:2-desacetyl-2-hydroxyethyl bacteriochlorophyllide A dehydrogenase
LKRLSLLFTGEKNLQIVESHVPVLQAGQVLVRSLVSAISAGTEMLIYRGQFPENLVQDEVIPALNGEFSYPFKYGYSLVGQVCDLAPDVASTWRDKLVFAFWPHESYFVASTDHLIPLPEGINSHDAVFLPNMETAVNFLMDARPLLGERVAVFGQGIVGLLTTSLLAEFPLSTLVTIDRYALRRQVSLNLGANTSLDPAGSDIESQIKESLGGDADLSLEVSGTPAALDQAMAVTGFSGRIVIGSWYGQKRAPLDLGGHFHRARLRLISSQVSSLAPDLTGRWDKSRRLDVAWSVMRRIGPNRFVTHQYQFADAMQAYEDLDQKPDDSIQVLLVYPE